MTFWYGSVPLTYGSGSRSCCFCQRMTRCQKNLSFEVYCFLPLKGIYAVKKKSKILEIKVLFTFFACWWKDPDPDPGGPKHTDPTDPDQQHWEVLSHLSRRSQARTTFEIISIYSRLGSGGCGDSCHLQVCSPLQGDWDHLLRAKQRRHLKSSLYISGLGLVAVVIAVTLSVFPSSGWLRSSLLSAKQRRPLKSSLYIFQAWVWWLWW